MEHLHFKEEVYQIIGAAIEVHSALGWGFLEAVYQEALEIELMERAILFASQVPIRIHYKDRPLSKEYVADIICFDQILLELKAVDKLGSDAVAQTLNYLNGTRLPLGLVINFGSRKKLEWKRLVLSEERQPEKKIRYEAR